MDSRIILAGQQPDFVNTLARSTQAAQQANQNQRQIQFNNMLAESGPGIVSGDQGAVNALARFDPGAAMGIQQTRQSMDVQRERLEIARAAAKRQAAAEARTLSAEQAAAAKEKLTSMLQAGAYFYENNKPEEYRQYLIENNMDPNNPKLAYDRLPANLLSVAGTLEAIEEARGMNAGPEPADEYQRYVQEERDAGREPLSRIDYAQAKRGDGTEEPAAVQSLRIRAQEAGLKPGTAEYQEFMRTGGRSNIVTEFTGDGFSYFSGPAPGANNSNTQEQDRPPPENQEAVGNEGFGWEGFFKNIVNTMSDAAAGFEAYPEAAEQIRLFKDLETDLLATISQTFPRQPAQRYMEIIRDTLPSAGNPIKGPEGARQRLAQLRQRFEDDLFTLEQQAKVSNRKQRQEIQAQALSIQKIVRRIDRGIQSLQEPGQGAADISDDDKEFMRSLGLEVE